jgi:hypothetical protein
MGNIEERDRRTREELHILEMTGRFRGRAALAATNTTSSVSDPIYQGRLVANDLQPQEMLYSQCLLDRGVNHEGGGRQDEESRNDGQGQVEDEVEQCSVCFENFEMLTRIKKLPCGHYYHVDCIDVWLDINPSCPLCRQDLRIIPTRRRAQRGSSTTATIRVLSFNAMLHPAVRFGVTIVATSAQNGLLVTYVEPRGAGNAQGVEIGDYLVRQDRVLIPRGLSDSAFVAQLVALGRPVELGFERRTNVVGGGSVVQARRDNNAVVPVERDTRSNSGTSSSTDEESSSDEEEEEEEEEEQEEEEARSGVSEDEDSGDIGIELTEISTSN